MAVFLKKLTSFVFTPVCWTFFTIILLCLPGSAFPSKGLFNLDIPHLDKIVHVILFGGMVVFWSLYYKQKNSTYENKRLMVTTIALSTIALGIGMEFIQLHYVPYRSFDTGDILANTLSAVAFGIYFYFKKP